MKIFLIFWSAILPMVLSEQWIDPHDMNPKPKPNLKKSHSTGNLGQSTDIPIQVNKENVEENNSLIYMKRFVNLILHSATVDKHDPSVYHGKLSFRLDNKSVQFLKDFSGSEKVSLDQLRKLDTIISDIFRKRYLDDVSDMLTLSQETLSDFLRKNGFLLIGSCVFIYVSYNLFRHNFSIGYIFRYLILTIIVVDYIQRYHQLSEEAEEHNMHLKYTSKCDTTKMSWGEYFKFMTSHEDCEKKVVSVLEVGLLQVRSLIIVPLSAAGTGMGQFGSELWGQLPFPWNILIFPIMLIFCLFLVVLMMTSINGTPFKVNLMHLFHIEFGEKKNVIGNSTLDKLLDMVGRPLVLDVNEQKRQKLPAKPKNPSKAIEGKKSSPDKSNYKKDKDKSEDKSKQKSSDSKNGLKSSPSNTSVEEAEKTPKKTKETIKAPQAVDITQ